MEVSVCDRKDLTDLQETARRGVEWPVDRSIRIEIFEHRVKDSTIYSDFPYFGSLVPLCLSPSVQSFFRKQCGENGYFVDTNLMTTLQGKEYLYRLLFLTLTLDALDLENSEFSTFTDGRVMRVYCHSIIENVIADHSIFKIKNTLGNDTFVTGDLKNQIEQAGLVGFLFSKIWSTEEGPFDIRLFSHEVNPGDRRKFRQFVSTKRKQARKILAARSASAPQ